MDNSLLGFSSDANYMKRSVDFTGSTTLTLPSFGNTVSTTVTHNLGYVPQFDVFIDIDNDGTIWSSEKVESLTDSSLVPGVDPTVPKVSYWSTTTALTISIDNTTSPTYSGSVVVYWIVYLDYGDV